VVIIEEPLKTRRGNAAVFYRTVYDGAVLYRAAFYSHV